MKYQVTTWQNGKQILESPLFEDFRTAWDCLTKIADMIAERNRLIVDARYKDVSNNDYISICKQAYKSFNHRYILITKINAIDL